MSLETDKIWKIYPSIKTLAYFHPIGNYIQLNDIRELELQEIFKNKLSNYEKYSVLVHEYQHWSDSVSTLWGQQKLLKIFTAFDDIFDGDEHNLYSLRILYNDFKKDKFHTYYTQSFNHIQGGENNRWKYSFSTGIRFDINGNVDGTKSIFFVRFRSEYDIDISRVPLTVASLLETTATNSEIATKLYYITQLKGDEQVVAFNIFSKELVSRLYNPKLTLYSVAVHTAANLLKIEDPVLAYKISSSIASLSLNLPYEIAKTIKIPEEYKQLGKNRAENLINENDKGFIFICLLNNYKDKFDGTLSISTLLKCSNLPEIKIIEKKISEESENLIKESFLEKNRFHNLLVKKFYTGNKIRQRSGIAQEKNRIEDFTIDRFDDKPYLICNDTYFETDGLKLEEIIRKISTAKDINREEWWLLHEFCENRIDLFNEICGV